ncbi:MAG TPA: crossover junction endodeoxyribonuclease RuvC [Candidatus Marinimicrobia bacterium]|nr:crossover junction endodeoxyribonuclease RuvC [Candidatus Neomarinimicrobiota bacterium]
MTLILGVDPGLNITGYGLIYYAPPRLEFVAAGIVSSPKNARLSERLVALYDGITAVIKQYQPGVFAIEETFYNKNAKTSLILGHARGVLMLSAARNQLPVFEYSARSVKKSITGNGAATKAQVRFMVERILKIKDLPDEMDISDALAIALTHHHHIKFQQLTKE